MTQHEINKCLNWLGTTDVDNLDNTDVVKIHDAMVKFAMVIQPIMIKHEIEDTTESFLFRL